MEGQVGSARRGLDINPEDLKQLSTIATVINPESIDVEEINDLTPTLTSNRSKKFKASNAKNDQGSKK